MAIWIIRLSAILIPALLLPPLTPQIPSSGLDSSWSMVLHYAFQRHWQFGRDIVFTFGPYGFVYTRMFDPDTYWLTLSAWIAIALLIGAAVSSLLDGRHKLAAIPAIAVLYLSLRVSPDAPFLMLPLLYAVMSF